MRLQWRVYAPVEFDDVIALRTIATLGNASSKLVFSGDRTEAFVSKNVFVEIIIKDYS